MSYCEICMNLFINNVKVIYKHFEHVQPNDQKTLKLYFKYSICCRMCVEKKVEEFIYYKSFKYNLSQIFLDCMYNFLNKSKKH